MKEDDMGCGEVIAGLWLLACVVLIVYLAVTWANNVERRLKTLEPTPVQTEK